MNPKLSVIVPVYKAEQYLHRCVDSILAQTFADFEVLLVNDGSPDRSGEICDEYTKKDSRVRVFHKPNGGVSSARNLALDNVNGEWVCFIDSDDFLDSNNFLSLYYKVNSTVDIVHFGYTIETKLKKAIKFCEFKKERNIDIQHFFQKGIFSSCSVSFFFSVKHLQKYKLRFNETVKYSEDREFIIKSVLLSDKPIMLLHNIDYVYTYNVTSATKSKRDFKQCLDDLVVLRSIYGFILQQNIAILPSVNSFISFLMLDSFLLVISMRYKLCNIKEILQCRRELIELSTKFPNIDNNFFRYKAFMMFPILTVLYYKLCHLKRVIIQKIKP